MNAALMNQITSGAPGVMIVVNAADLRNVINGMIMAKEKAIADALAAQRERPAMTREETAEALGVSKGTLWRWAKDGYLVPAKIGTKVMYRVSDVEEVLKRIKAKK